MYIEGKICSARKSWLIEMEIYDKIAILSKYFKFFKNVNKNRTFYGF